MNYNQLINHRNARNSYSILSNIITTEIREGYAKCELNITEDHFNVINVVAGGALFTLMDSAGGATANSYGARVTTLSSSVEFLNAIKEPKKVYGIGRTLKRGKNIIVVDTLVEDDQGKCYAQGTFTYFNLKAPFHPTEENNNE